MARTLTPWIAADRPRWRWRSVLAWIPGGRNAAHPNPSRPCWRGAQQFPASASLVATQTWTACSKLTEQNPLVNQAATHQMKFAILADIHSNLEALQAVLEHAKQQARTDYAFLGDFVGYRADPKACLDIVRAMEAPCVKGNHDEYCAAGLPLDGFNPNAAKVVDWTRRQLTPDDRRWLQNLPYVRQVGDFTIVHATLDAPQCWGYVFD